MEKIDFINKIPEINPDVDFHYRDGEHVISIKNTNLNLKIGTETYELLQLVDDKKNTVQITNEFNKNYNGQIDANFVYKLFFEKLGHYNIIINENHEYDFNTQPSYLKLNIIIINASIAQLISKPFQFLFTKLTLRILFLVCFLIMFLAIISNFDEIIINLMNISFENIILYFSLMILSSFLHELGHVTATYKFGGEHSGIGIGFYLFTPVLYANVSSAWKFDVNKRIIVNIAGIYFELLFGTLLVLFSFVMDSKVLLILPSVIFIKTLFNLNPFFRTDGYWILSDALRMPNLRTMSNNLLKNIFKNKINGQATWKVIFLIIYALISNSLILVFLFYLFIINPNSLITFPQDIYKYVLDGLNNEMDFNISSISSLLLPLFFYILLFRFIFNLYRKKLWKRD